MKQITKYLVLTVLVIVMMSSVAVAFAAQGGLEGVGGHPGRGVGGEVTAVDGANIQVENPRGEATIVTDDNTEFVVNGETGSLADIEVGMFVLAKGERNDDGTFSATHVFASDEAPQRPDDGQGGRPGRGVGGEVIAIDGANIQVENPRGEATIVTDDNTEFVVNGEAGSLADIEVGMFVGAKGERNDAGTFSATHVFASDEAPQRPDDGQGRRPGRGVGGEVIAIDGANIQVENPRGEATIVTDDNTEFVVNGEAGSLADIEVGMFVLAKGEKNDDGTFSATHVFASDEAPQRPDDGQGQRPGPRKQ